MSQQYYTLVTNIGAARIAKATALGTVVNFTHMAVGDGGGQAVTPAATMTELKREVYRAHVNLLQIDEQNQNQIIAELLIPEEEGDFTIREVGLFAANGDLIAVGNLPDNYKPRASSGTASQQIVRMIIQVDNTGAVGIKVDPAVVLATRDFVTREINSKISNCIVRINSIEALRAYRGHADVVFVESYYGDGGAGGGIFIRRGGGDEDGGLVIVSDAGVKWRRDTSDVITPFDFGARGDGQTDDTAAFEALERVVAHRRVDLSGKVFKVARNFKGNHYVCGTLTVSRNQDFANGQPMSAQSLLGNGLGSLLTMVKTHPDIRPGRAARSIMQGAAQDPRSGDWWILQPYTDVPDDAGDTIEASVLVRYPAKYAGAGEIEHVQVSEASAYFGHQCIGINYHNGQRYFWATGGMAKKTKRQLYVVRFQIGADNRIENLSEYTMFSDGLHNGDGNNCLAVSPCGQFIAVTCKYTDSNRWICRVWRMSDLNHGGDNTNNWLYEFPLRSHGLPVQSIALDGNYIYVLHGGDAAKANVYSVFAIDGNHIMDYTGDGTGKDKMAELARKGYNEYYEPEAFAVANIGGQLVLTQWIMLGKKDNHHACAVYAMRPLLPNVAMYPTTHLAAAAVVPKDYIVQVDAAGADKKVLWSGYDGNTFVRACNNGNYIGLTTVNDESKSRKFGVCTYSGGGAITFYNKEDLGGASENLGILRLAGAISESYLDIGRTEVYPSHTDKASLGKANKRWTQVFAQSGVIATSDERLKQDIGSIPDAVIEAWRAVGWCQFRWRDAVAEKGAGARYHTGLIAQSIKAAFDAHGLDAQDYGLLCYDQWPETPAREAVVDEHGNVLEQAVEHQPTGERWSVRIDECLVLEAESNRRLVQDLSDRLNKLERRRKRAEVDHD